jgi:metacaspase-1
MGRFFSTIVFSIVSTLFSQPVKRALVVTIGNYPNDPSKNQTWSDLASENDRSIVLKQLQTQEFAPQNIVTLSEEQATANKIRSAFNDLVEKSKKGDIVYFHFSGHGHQVSDLTSNESMNKLLYLDELDGFDEALVAYDAPFKAFEGYRLQHHIVDDEINYYLTKLKRKMGSTGQIIAVFDACHSGTLSRGGETERVRGSGQALLIEKSRNQELEVTNQKDKNRGFELDFSFSSLSQSANLIVFSGCKAQEKNREYYDPRTKKYYGSLSFALVNNWTELTVNSTYKDWYSKINEFISLKFNNTQHPEVEGDLLDVSVMNGALVEADIFYEVNHISNRSVVLNAGQLNGLNLGDSIAFYPLEIKKVADGLEPIAVGTVSELRIDESIVDLVASYDDGKHYNKYNMKALVIHESRLAQTMRVGLTVVSKKIRKQIINSLLTNNNIEIVKNGSKILLKDTLLNPKTKTMGIIARFAHSGLLVQDMPYKTIWNLQSYDTLWSYLENTLRVDLFREITLVSKDYYFDIKLQRISKNDTSGVDLNFAKYLLGDILLITLTNNSAQEMRFHLLDIYPTNQVEKVDRNNGISSKIISPGASIRIPLGPVGEPLGLEQLKIVASPQSIDFSPILNFGRALTQTRGNTSNYLMDFIAPSFKQGVTRGGNGDTQLTPVLTIKNIFFEILPLHQNI